MDVQRVNSHCSWGNPGTTWQPPGSFFHQDGARHQGEKSVANVEVQEIAAPFIRHQQQAAIIQLPEILHGQAWCSVVLGEHAQLPATGAREVVQLALQGLTLSISEHPRQVDHRGGVIGQQVRIVIRDGGGRPCGSPSDEDGDQEGERPPRDPTTPLPYCLGDHDATLP